jgi:hypothetical protein
LPACPGPLGPAHSKHYFSQIQSAPAHTQLSHCWLLRRRLGEEEAARQASLAALATALADKQAQLGQTEQRLAEASERLEGAEGEAAATEARLQEKAERLRGTLREEVAAARRQVCPV